jgi:ketosteroid isomerase-like protein
MAKDNVEVVRRSIEAYNRKDLPAMQAVSHPDLEVDWSASRGLEAGVYRGFEETDGFYENWFDMFEQLRVEPERFIESGDLVLVPNTAVLRGRDGIETVARSCISFELREGRIARICLYQETHEALDATGLSTRARARSPISNQRQERARAGRKGGS